MIPADLAARLRMLADASFFNSGPAVPGTERIRELSARLPQLLPGQPFTATIQRPLPDGTYQAVVAGRNYTLALSQVAKPGDTLELIVTKNTPNAVFAQLAPPGATGAEAGSRPSLSATGQLISFLLTGQPAPAAPQLAAGKPLLPTPPTPGTPAPPQLAPVLRQALTQSGLFYESHQLKWISGKLDTAALLREPQGQAGAQRPALPGAPAAGAGASGATPTPAPAGGAGPAASAASSANVANTGTSTAAQSGVARLASNMAAVSGVAASAETDGRSERLSESLSATQTRAAAIPDRVLPLVHQQLDSMATQNYVLQGLAWPGQPFQWEIEDQQGGQGEQDDSRDDWNTTLRLTMPRLGQVEARMQLTPAGVALRLVAGDADTVAALQAARAQLDSALDAAGVALTGFVVEQRSNE